MYQGVYKLFLKFLFSTFFGGKKWKIYLFLHFTFLLKYKIHPNLFFEKISKNFKKFQKNSKNYFSALIHYQFLFVATTKVIINNKFTIIVYLLELKL